MVRIARMYYPVTALGPGRRMGIWTAGCPRRCPGCMSPELQNAGAGQPLPPEAVLAAVETLPQRPEGFTISGGEPFMDPKGLRALLEALCAVSDDILVYTGFTLEELRALENPEADAALALCAALVDGPYIEALNDGTGLRGSGNQRLHVFRYPERYAGLESQPRTVQAVRYGDRLLTIGIP